MNIRKTVILAIALLLPLSISAQKRKKRVKKPVVEVPQEDPRITSMREMTQQITIIDSIVADKDQLLSLLRLSDETGRILSSSAFWGKGDSTTVFVNEMGNKAYFSQPDDSLKQQLCTSDLLGGEWSKPQLLNGISEGISETAYPFMLADGLTFYFAGKGEESIGGYDIFMTRYDAHNNSRSTLRPTTICLLSTNTPISATLSAIVVSLRERLAFISLFLRRAGRLTIPSSIPQQRFAALPISAVSPTPGATVRNVVRH